ncbi:hypothetical protein PV755_09565 [Streptomyces caniscabiei]|uniref:Uncharacterized protein n=1 Tax=Streptomyces caniscabiei TaxID=2746961 RepID=A0A927QHJ3_9ACTN|nr:hypothetical protein [Streptomyces caniscabiei]MBD9721977.1 hypothetical protein [Streptomyces caniscabiei]MDX3509169.1 hypothetical protein [Streptomyces caniscabiei]MDX3717078.1 hypothetical protein [Streptomyces caniscabiei]WEO22946.1 hypothetical protein IHE65_07160 [Streptomyces caniscabiei]
MAFYIVSYDNGQKQKLTAHTVEYDIDSEQYIFTDSKGGVVSLSPRSNVLNILRQGDEVTG